MTLKTNILQVIQGTPERKSGFIGRTCLGVWISILALIFVGAGEMQAQTFKNGGVFRNTGTANYKEVQNYNGTAGTILNSGTINITKNGSGSLLNDDFGSLKGTVLNYIGGIGAGTIVCNSTTGDYSNGGGITRNDSLNNYVGTIKIQGALTSTGTFDTDTGKVEYLGTGGQTIFTATYGILAASTSGIKSLASGTTIVNNSVQISGTATIDVAGNTLTLNGSNPFPSGGTLTANTANSTVIYNASGAQTVYSATYDKLTIQNGGTKTASGSITVNNTLTNTATFDLSTNSLTLGAVVLITNTGATIQTAGIVTFGATPTIGGTFIYQAATGTQSIGIANYTNLTLSSGSGAVGQKNLPAGIVSVSGTYSVSGGNRDYATNSSVFQYNGTTQSILTESYYSLTLIGGASDVKTAAGAITLAAGGTLTNTTGIFDMDTYALGVTSVTKNNTGTIRFAGATNGVVFANGTVVYNGGNGITQTIAAGDYATLLLVNGSGSGTADKLVDNNATVQTSGGLDIAADVRLTLGNSGSTLNVGTSGTGDFTMTGLVVNNGTINVGN